MDRLMAQKSFNAILGTSRLTAFGGGVDVLNVWKTLFLRAGVSHTTMNGSRAFVVNGQGISLNIPITVSMTPVEIGGGWRFSGARLGRHVVVPYAGSGALIQPYSERSPFGSGGDVSQTNTGFTFFGGVEVDLSKWFLVGVEGQYRGLPHAIGTAPVSKDFGETNLGGFTARVLVGLKH
jgi:opacity protein-like surface antigen